MSTSHISINHVPPEWRRGAVIPNSGESGGVWAEQTLFWRAGVVSPFPFTGDTPESDNQVLGDWGRRGLEECEHLISHLLAQEEFTTGAGFTQELGKNLQKETKTLLSLLLRFYLSDSSSNPAFWDLWLSLAPAGQALPTPRTSFIPTTTSPPTNVPPFPILTWHFSFLQHPRRVPASSAKGTGDWVTL